MKKTCRYQNTPAIEKNIPIPLVTSGINARYPWDELKVGESFMSRVQEPQLLSNPRRLATQRTGFKFAIRKTKDGVRVWRVA